MKTKKITKLIKLKRIYYLIRNLLGFPIENTNSRHFKNLNSNKSIEINGKRYFKVNLRFVDTLDSDSTRFLFQLEEEIESLRIENTRITNLNSHLEKKNRDLETLNINLLNENRIQSAIYIEKTKVNQEKLNDTQKKLNEKIRDNKELINSIKYALHEKNDVIKEKNIKIQNYQIALKQKEKEIKLLQKILTDRKEIVDKNCGGQSDFLKEMNRIKK